MKLMKISKRMGSQIAGILPEIEQELSALWRRCYHILHSSFNLMKRGMLCTSYLNLKIITDSESLAKYTGIHKDEFLCGSRARVLPETKNVSGSNFIDISVNFDKRTNKAIVISALDNLEKVLPAGVQCMNIMLGLNETGLLSSLYL